MICPCDTPDGEGCGLDKNLAITAFVTTSSRKFRTDNLGVIEGNILKGNGYRVTVDGTVIGYTVNDKLVRRVRAMRRRGLIEKFVNIALIKRKNENYGEIMINTDSGRLVRPLLVIENGKLLLTENMLKKLSEGKINFNNLLEAGVIEFLDVNEEDNSFIALKAS